MKTLPIGTTGVAAHDLSSFVCIIKQGERVTITGIDNAYHSRGYTLTDTHGNTIMETGFNSIIPDKF